MKQATRYNGLVRLYNRYHRKLHRFISERKNLRKQDILQRRLTKLFKSLTVLQRTLKLGMATAAISVGMLLFQPNASQAQVISFDDQYANPFGLTPLPYYYSIPTFADLDNDGDLDMMAGERYGNFYYFQNTGTAAIPDFAPPQTNPFGLTDIGTYSSPAFADLDGDGDLDLLTGERYGKFFYFQNTGTTASPAFAAMQTNPFGLTVASTFSTPAILDLDGDGDLDILSGANNGSFYYYKNNGTSTTPAFAAKQTNPLGLTNTYNFSSPAFADIDSDGDFDLMAGQGGNGYGGRFLYYKNNGTASVPAFAAKQTTPFGLTALHSYSTPTFADLDDDGDFDLLSGEYSGDFFYFKNTGSAIAPAFVAAPTNPFGLPDLGLSSRPSFTDLDNDGDLDLLAGAKLGNFYYFQNTGTAAAPVFSASQTNPFGLTALSEYSAPAFADLDADGDMDMMSGDNDGDFFYFKNIGTSASPSFAAKQTNPFGLTAQGSRSTLAFADLDGDGDLDIMSSELFGRFFYFQNTGTASAPAFAAVQINPFGLSDIGNGTYPAFADLDKDGDLDLLTGHGFGSFRYLPNTGIATAPAFGAAQQTPLGLTDVGFYSAPALADLDDDGDMDLMSGELYGGFIYFENITSCYGETVFADADDDGYGDASSTLFVADCIAPAGYVTDNTDCDDAAASVNPGATEVCGNNIDENCNGIADENCNVCETPAGLTTTNITSTKAKLNWNAVAGAISYKIQYKVSGTNAWLKKSSSGTSKNINGLSPNTNYVWRVKSKCGVNPALTSDWSVKQFFTTALREAGQEILIADFSIYPNPADEQTTLHFTLMQSSHVSIKVFDVSGREMTILLNADLQQGDHSLEINTGEFSKGVYVVRMVSDGASENEKLIVE